MAGAASAIACVGMASCIQVYEPVVQLDTLADPSKPRKVCHVHPGRHRVALWVPTQEDTCMLRYMRGRMGVRFA